ncbi:MAG: RNA-binding protein [Polyangiaceae bacterium]|nr:RNA-binding protein [Polyangiaceae bacterium]
MRNRLYVGNLSSATTQAKLEHIFSEIGQVTEVVVPLDRATGNTRGFAFVMMSTTDGAVAAIEQLHGTTLDGQVIKVREAEERRPSPPGARRPRGS